ncbi:uncharacterized protein MELLADRAFT_62191 [Melampsora larici-populina 98AG31]|uniref:Uncharacterized protein n=1 Tax=Melampsora larici-populina (strain 98AG31 / pathotype 3-4-7) TaxID=747676 RepID=F4RHX9_MELLP|nr:uncharacterized protein MELLADRAFT_62191 [Melampsora larici-populina 98AG31]EGG08054.1 hypothetical protein MELLADRAFT_62191 [Melampsora larici-populina 98AG31]
MKDQVRTNLANSGDQSKIDFAARMSEGADVVILKVWRPIVEVTRNHLGIRKWNSVLEGDALKLDSRLKDDQDALQAWKYNNRQQWFFASNQQPHEVFVMMQHNSTAPDGHGINVPHAAFNIEGHQSTYSRPSYETKVIAIINDPPTSLRDKIRSSLSRSKISNKVHPGKLRFRASVGCL